MNNVFHIPVLLKEVIDFLEVEKDKKYIDATLGGGGHTLKILEKGGKVLCIDADQDAIEHFKDKLITQKLKFEVGKDLIIAHDNFRNIDKIASLNEFKKVSGVLFDLGVSSYQLEKTERGFSFQREAILDMRMDQRLKVKAFDLINALTKGELYELFTKLGEEPNARTISNNIIQARRIKPIETTTELAMIIRKSVRGFSRINEATKVFQALRIAVNDELNNLTEALPKAMDLLENKGKLLVISFHSLEDRIVKNVFNDLEKKNIGKILTDKPILPSKHEIEINSKSRSSKLRIIQKII